MDAKTFYSEFGEGESKRVSEAAGTTLEYFKQVMYDNRKFSPKLAVKIVVASEGRMTRAGLRPDIWGSEQAA
jgi:DNA-binding transcriptional regulator YdaS (Cro superfamily)